MKEPLSNEQVWGVPEDFEEDKFETDQAIEDILANNEVDVQEADYFDGANWCPNCGEPVYLCQCDLINQGEDYEGNKSLDAPKK